MSFLYNNVREMINYPIKLQLIFEETNRKKFYSKVDVQLRRRSVTLSLPVSALYQEPDHNFPELKVP